ncbi:restriction endonuclease subunit S [Rhodovulum sulfidophilum]|uniref:Restriction endonuclease subunit S n=1 Tax=Rhodovulum sulfidophilum TaxID=35806 RepID=A0ABS1RY14_RHOSU|nr:restriction endonuclease subunit S [Rhodovulum sulfidophilum]MBL3609995.1 restriction endonuclease subunit S [Rhodovulum sulfidophilum]MCE8454996.1 restriction endonuclease subunit S [Rhodovulum sulfidophilum]
MSAELPDGWTAARFRDVMRLEDRREPIAPIRSYRLLGVRWYGNGAFLREERLGDELSAQHIYRVQPGDVIYNRLFAWKGSFALVGDDLADCYVSNEFPLFAARLDRVDPQFLLRVLQHPRTSERADAFSTGTTSISRNRLSEDDFLHFPLALPPLAEQRAIAEALGSVEAAIAKTEALIAALAESRVELTRDFQGSEEHSKWPARPIGSLIRKCQYGLSIPLDGDGSVPVLRMPDIRDGRVNLDVSTLKSTDVSTTEVTSCEIKEGDILFNRTNSQALVGKTGIVRSTPCAQIVFASYLIRLVVNSDINAFWLNAVLNLPRTQERLKALATPGVSQWNINSKTLKRFEVAVPPKANQDQFANLYESIEAALETERTKLTAMNEARYALAQELLSGRIRLPDSLIVRHRDNAGQAA